MGTHTQNLCSAINPSKVHTHSSKHTHTVNTHPEQWAVNAAALGSIRGFGALLKGSSVMVLRVERVLYINQPPPPQFLPDRDSNSLPLDYEGDSLTIRPWLPPIFVHMSLLIQIRLLFHRRKNIKLKGFNNGFVSYKHTGFCFTRLTDGLEWCGLLWCFYQLFGPLFWRHPFTAEDPQVNKWCNATFLQIWWRNKFIYILDELRGSKF